jgi:hypothetical protein
MKYFYGAVALVAASVAGTPAAVGGEVRDAGAAASAPVDLSLPLLPVPPADTGKPAVVAPSVQFAYPERSPPACLPALPCGTRVIGEVRKNGAVELQVPALRW